MIQASTGFRLWAWVLLALAAMAAGIELDRQPFAETWQPLSTRAVLEAKAPVALGWLDQFGQEYAHPRVWTGLMHGLEWPPALLLLGAASVFFLLGSLRSGVNVPAPAGLGNFGRWAGLALLVLAASFIGADLYANDPDAAQTTAREVWTRFGGEIAAGAELPQWAKGFLEWPAWVWAAVPGLALLLLCRKRQPALPPYAPTVIQTMPIPDMNRTLAYLESMRGWPPRTNSGPSAGGGHPDAPPVQPSQDPRFPRTPA